VLCVYIGQDGRHSGVEHTNHPCLLYLAKMPH